MKFFNTIVAIFFGLCVVNNTPAFALKTYVLQQNSKISGLEMVSFNSQGIKIVLIDKKIEILYLTNEHKVCLINHKNKKYYKTLIDNILDPSGQGFYRLFLEGGKELQNPQYWIKGKTFACVDFQGTIFTFKYNKKYNQEPNTFSDMYIADFKNLNPQFVKLHAKINGLPIMPNLILRINAYNNMRHLFHLIDTKSIKIEEINFNDFNLQGLNPAKSYNDFLNLTHPNNEINDMLNLIN